MAKAQRHQVIADLIRHRRIHSQQELQALLAKSKIRVTQTTLSRDLREMAVFKGPAGYVLPSAAAADAPPQAALARAVRSELRSVDGAANTVVIRTQPGHANALAVEIDRAQPNGVLGTLAGDDTIVVVARTAKSASALMSRLRSLASA